MDYTLYIPHSQKVVLITIKLYINTRNVVFYETGYIPLV